jgi:hypothetical protein
LEVHLVPHGRAIHPGTKRRFVATQDLRQLSVLSGHAAGSFLLSQALMLITSGKPSKSAAILRIDAPCVARSSPSSPKENRNTLVAFHRALGPSA